MHGSRRKIPSKKISSGSVAQRDLIPVLKGQLPDCDPIVGWKLVALCNSKSPFVVFDRFFYILVVYHSCKLMNSPIGHILIIVYKNHPSQKCFIAQDQSIADAKVVIDLIDAIKPGAINYELIKDGGTDEVSCVFVWYMVNNELGPFAQTFSCFTFEFGVDQFLRFFCMLRAI
jgi:hypothetical protein